jgi:predicted nucleotidyltransferase
MRFASELPLLTPAERSCLDRYVQLLEETLGEGLREILVYGSVARGESWPRGMPIRSDLDLLVVTDERVPEDRVAALIDATMPLFLECGRQLGPVFKTVDELRAPTEFVRQARRDGVRIYAR